MVSLIIERVAPSGIQFDPISRVLDAAGATVYGWNGYTLYDIGPLSAAGSPYRIEVEDSGHNDTGTYRLHLQRLTASQACESKSITCDLPLQDSIEDKVDSDLLVFAASEGEMVAVRFGRVAPSGLLFDPMWRVLNAAGATVLGWNGYTLYDIGPLSAAGSPYRIEVEDSGHHDTGTYRLHLQRLTASKACDSTPFACDVPLQRNIEDSFDSDLMAFSAAEGEIVSLSFGRVAPSGLQFDPIWRLLSADGATVVGFNGYTLYDLGPLAAAGSPYRIEVEDSGHNDAGAYRMHLQRLTASQACERNLITCNVPLQRSIQDGFDSDLLVFRVIEGQAVGLSIDRVNPSGLQFDPIWRVLRADGTQVVGFNSSPQYDLGVLPSSGNPYRIEVEDSGHDDTGTYVLTLNGCDVTAVDPIPSTPALHMGIVVSPNPLVEKATVDFVLPEAGYAQLQLFDVSGRLHATLVDGFLESGRHQVIWNTSGLPGGLYYCRFSANGESVTRRAAVLK